MRERPAGSASPASPSPLVSQGPGRQDANFTHFPPQIPDHELLQPVGRGAYGDVWLARNVIGTLRAVKVVYRHHFGDEHPFDRELRGIQKFEPVSRSHPGLVDILQIGRNDSQGYFYYVMELADDATPAGGKVACPPSGQAGRCKSHSKDAEERRADDSSSYQPRTLRSDLKLRGRLPFDECLQLGLSLTSALEHLHRHGLVHRDVKPSNIIFVNGQPKLADIGLVAGLDEARSFVGTEGFIPPEGPGKPQADLYSLGIVLYVMSTGKHPDTFPDPRLDLGSDPDRTRWVELNAIIHKACHGDSRERYQSAEEMHADLVRLQAGKSVRRQQRLLYAMKLGRQAAPIAALVVVLALSVTWATRRQTVGPVVPPEKASVFVLPFRMEGSNAVPDDLSGRITDAFIDSLALIDGVRRSPRKSGWVYQDEAMLCQSLAKTNDMRHILTGRISGSSDVLTLTLRLNKKGEARPVWSESFSGTTNDVVSLERHALAQLISTLGLKITDTEQPRIDQLLTGNMEALKWMRHADGMYQNQAGTQVGFLQVHTLAQKALESDPKYLDAEFLDVALLRDRAVEQPAREAWPSIGLRLERILEQDDTHAAALDCMCGFTLFFKRDWPSLWPLVERVHAASDPQSREWLVAMLYRIHGWFEEARIHQRRSEDPEPIGVFQLCHMAHSRRVDRLWAEGAQASRRAVELYPSNSFGYHALAYCLIGGGNFEQGLETIEKVTGAYLQQDMAALKGYAYAKMGQRAKAREVLSRFNELRRTDVYVQPYFVARIHAALGENEAALDWLEKAAEDKSEHLLFPDLGGLRTDPAWDGLQNEPRYWQLCDRLGLGKNQWPRSKHQRMP